MFKKIFGLCLMTLLAYTVSAQSLASPKVRFRWEGIYNSHGNNHCAGGDCGLCLGFCITSGFMTPTQASTQPNQSEIGDLNVALISSTQMTAQATQAWDNGTGTVTITNDFSIGSDYSKALGANVIIVKQGVYTLDFTGSRYGTATFTVVVN